MDDEFELVELVRLRDIERIFDVKQALAARGVDSEVWGNWIGNWHGAGGQPKLRLMVRPRDLVYARWVAYAAGIDAWPDENDGDAARDRAADDRAAAR